MIDLVSGTMKMIDVASNTTPKFKIAISEVGVKDLKYPAHVPGQGMAAANFSMSVNINADDRGTHMSRFIDILNQQQWELGIKSFSELKDVILDKFKSNSCRISATFTKFLNKKAPVSGIASISDYQACYQVTSIDNQNKFFIALKVPVTTLCPCSKAISEYGAHSQRTTITTYIEVLDDIDLDSLILELENCGSSPLYSLLKREDEKYVTEGAYDNPRFVEDTVREAANLLGSKSTISAYRVEVESIESIHNHSAVAKLDSENFTSPWSFSPL